MAIYRVSVFVALLLIFGLSNAPVASAALININTAVQEELDTLPGVGPTIAQRIIDGRPYASVEEISEVEGIGEPGSSTYDNIIGLITVGETETQEAEEEEGESDEPEEGSGSRSKPVEIEGLSVSISGAKSGVVGAPIYFTLRSNHKLKKGNYVWSFGDGATGVGEKTEHAYLYPGEYVVVLRARAREAEAVSQIALRIVPDTMNIADASPERVEVFNDGTVDINLYGRKLQAGEKVFIFPQDTIIKAGQRIAFPAHITGLAPQHTGAVSLLLVGQELVIEPSDPERERRVEELTLELSRAQRKLHDLLIAQQTAAITSTSTTSPSNQTASAMQSLETSIQSDRDGWISIVRKFFGF